MNGIDDLLFYSLAAGDQPVCPKCCSPLVLVGFQSERGMPDFSSFRCSDCGRSESGHPLRTTSMTAPTDCRITSISKAAMITAILRDRN
jgi:transposase-like protein